MKTVWVPEDEAGHDFPDRAAEDGGFYCRRCGYRLTGTQFVGQKMPRCIDTSA